ncbi:MAG: 2-amino-4-hydroxy-6-hydroxymethyldihydropteridine diphosphokinase [Mariprofundaceae bacterium]
MGVSPKYTYFIALGGNLGDIRATFLGTRDRLEALDGCQVTANSLLYHTSPIGPEGQPDYLNAVIQLASLLPPESLLKHMQAVEISFGRKRSEYWGPRTLDLDIIACADMMMDTPELTIPHPHMHERMFVLRPLCDIAPDWHHPRLNLSAQSMMDALLTSGERPLTKGEAW